MPCQTELEFGKQRLYLSGTSQERNSQYGTETVDLIEAIKGLWKDANLFPHMTFAPSKVYVDFTKSDHIYSEMWTGQWWHVLQVCVFNTANNLLMLTNGVRTM